MSRVLKNIRMMQSPQKQTICSIWKIIDECRAVGKTKLADGAVKELGNQLRTITKQDSFENDLRIRRELLYHLHGWDYEVKKGLMRSECLKYAAV